MRAGADQRAKLAWRQSSEPSAATDASGSSTAVYQRAGQRVPPTHLPALRVCALPIAPILENWTQLQSDELLGLEPESIFVNTKHVPPGPLPQATWDWIVYETVDPRVAADYLQRGVHLVETFDYPTMSAALETGA